MFANTFVIMNYLSKTIHTTIIGKSDGISFENFGS